jgi:hypothetical protein
MSDSPQESQKCHLSKIRPHGLANATFACRRGKVLAQIAVEMVELASPSGAATGAHRRHGLGHSVHSRRA